MKCRNWFQLSLLFYCLFIQLHNSQCVPLINSDTDYTPPETKALKKLKGEISDLVYADYQKLDFYLVHFLRLRDLDVNKTKALLEENFQWREDNRIDSILQEKEMIQLEKVFPFTIDGVDKGGRPILSYSLSQWDIQKFILAGNAEEYRRYQIYMIEKITQRIYSLALAGKGVSQFTLLADYGGFNIRQHACMECLQGFAEFALLIESRYPHLGQNMILVNVPRSFETIMELVRQLRPASSLENVHIFGHDRTEWRKYLQQVINDDQISTTFGGTRLTEKQPLN